MHALHYTNELLVRVRLAFLKRLQTSKRAETTRNYQKQVLVIFNNYLFIYLPHHTYNLKNKKKKNRERIDLTMARRPKGNYEAYIN